MMNKQQMKQKTIQIQAQVQLIQVMQKIQQQAIQEMKQLKV